MKFARRPACYLSCLKLVGEIAREMLRALLQTSDVEFSDDSLCSWCVSEVSVIFSDTR